MLYSKYRRKVLLTPYEFYQYRIKICKYPISLTFTDKSPIPQKVLSVSLNTDFNSFNVLYVLLCYDIFDCVCFVMNVPHLFIICVINSLSNFILSTTVFVVLNTCLLYTNIVQTLKNSLHRLLNCEIGELDCHVITTEYRTRVHCIHM